MLSNSELFHLLALQITKGIGSKSIRKLLQYYGSAQSVFKARAEELLMVTGKTGAWASSLQNSLAKAELEWKYCEARGIRLLSINDPDYPPLLRHCPDAPNLLFCKGNLPENSNNSHANIDQILPSAPILGIVGTRDASFYGIGYTEKIVTDLLQFYPQLQIISGLAKGIDIAAHKACLNLNATTIAVVAHGFEYLFPAEHKIFAEKICEYGAILTEYPSFVMPERSRFPARNRIIAGMSEVLLIMESKIKGGAMITANLGLEYNREVFALPGDISREQSLGCHKLIADNKARIFVDIPDMISVMNWDIKYTAQTAIYKTQSAPQTASRTSNKTAPQIAKTPIIQSNIANSQPNIINYKPPILEAKLQRIYTLLSNVPMHFDEFMQSSEISYTELSAGLLELELSGYIKSLPGNLYALNA